MTLLCLPLTFLKLWKYCVKLQKIVALLISHGERLPGHLFNSPLVLFSLTYLIWTVIYPETEEVLLPLLYLYLSFYLLQYLNPILCCLGLTYFTLPSLSVPPLSPVSKQISTSPHSLKYFKGCCFQHAFHPLTVSRSCFGNWKLNYFGFRGSPTQNH